MGYDYGPTVIVTGCTFTANTASGSAPYGGGGILLMQGTAAITNSTFSGNASSADGGGVCNLLDTLTITNSTFTANSAASGGGGGIYQYSGTGYVPAVLNNTIVALNTDGTGPSAPADDIAGSVNTADSYNNLIGTGGSGGLVNGTNGNLVGIADPGLAPLGSYGGPTETVALLPGSPAIDAASATFAPATDQRGISRPQSAAPDVGAFESQGFTITVTGGNDQSSPGGGTFAQPLAVTVSSAYGEPVAGGAVTFTAPASGASASFPSGGDIGTATVDRSGVASIAAIANSTIGSYRVSASATGIAASPGFNLTNLVAYHLVIHVQPSSTATAGQPFATQPVVYEEDASGNLVTTDNTTQVTASLAAGSGPLQGTAMVTLSGGIGTFTNLGDNTAETLSIEFTSSSGAPTVTSSNIVVSPAAPSQLVIHTEPSPTATAGSAFAAQPVVYVEDAYGNLETGDSSTQVTASLQTGSGPLQGTTTVTDSGGIATFAGLADNKAETIALQFTSAGLTSATSSSIAVSPAAPSQLVVHTQPSGTATAGTAFGTQPVIYVEDRYGNLETGDNSTRVTSALQTGAGPLQGTTTVTDSGGIATFTNLADNKAETIAIKFASSVAPAFPISSNIVVSPAAATKLVIQTQPSPMATAGQPFAAQPVVYVEDAYGNLETGDSSTSVTASLATGSGPLQGTVTVNDSGGIATFTNLADNKAETITLRFTSVPILTPATSTSIAVSPAQASKLVINSQPSRVTVHQPFSPAPVVYEEDAFGNLETGDNSSVIAAALHSGAGPLEGTLAATVSGGIATFTNLLDNTSEPITLVFSGMGVSSAVSTTITVGVGPATQLVVDTQPSPTATAGAPFRTRAVVYEEDAYGNLETGDNTTRVTATVHAGSGPLVGTTTVTVSGGIATFTNLADNRAETVALQCSSVPVLSEATSNNIVVSPAAPSQLVVITQPSPTATAGVPFGTQPVVYEEDAYGNLETGDNTTQVTASLRSGAGPLQGTTTVTVSGGIATFTNLADNKAENIMLMFTAPTLIKAQAGSTTVNPAAASRLSITAPASATVGKAFTITVTAYDPYGNVATGYRGTVHLTSSDHAAWLPSCYAFTASDAGSHTFGNGVKLMTSGTQTITVNDVNNQSVRATASVQVTSPTPLPGVTAAAATGSQPGTAITSRVRTLGQADAALDRVFTGLKGNLNAHIIADRLASARLD